MGIEKPANVGHENAFPSWLPQATRTRRQILGTGGLLAAATLAASCDAFSTDPASEAGASDDGGDDRKEAPQLTELVEAGELPPLEERLPTDVEVVEPHDQPGQYGGTWRIFGDGVPLGGGAGVESDWLVRWSNDWSEVQPNLAKDWDIEDDGRVFTFYLREGVKWSDGEPWGAHDLEFTYVDVLSNADLYPGGVPSLFISGGEPATFETIDEHTIRFTFTEPAGLLLEFLPSAGIEIFTKIPKHYFAQFHPAHTDGVEELASDEGYDTWMDLFEAKGGLGHVWYPEVPSIMAWHTTAVEDQGGRLVMDRNPYYWKTDADGRQLPYLDRVVNVLYNDQESAMVSAMNGEFDFLAPTFYNPNLGTVENKPAFAESREQGNYDFVDGLSSTMSMFVIALNLCVENDVLREVFRNKDFRIGLSYAMDREEIIDAVYQRQGEPWQAAPREESDFYHEVLAKQYIEYDPELADEHLDSAGYTERDSGGFRLGPDGNRIRFQMDVISQEPTQIAALEIIQSHWQDVGVDMQLNSMVRDLFYDRKEGNQHQANVWTGDGGLRDAMIDPRFYMAINNESNFAIPWVNYYLGTDPQEEPPEAARRQQEIYDEIKVTVDEDARRELLMEILEIAVEEFWAIGTVLPIGFYGIKRNDFHNVPDPMIASWRYRNPGPSHPEQFFTTRER